MENQCERLSVSAMKAKRNIWFFTILAWALCFEWIKIKGEKISIAGIGAETEINTIIAFLFAVLVFNLFFFWLHGPLGDSRMDERIYWLLNPTSGFAGKDPNVFYFALDGLLGKEALLKIIGEGKTGAPHDWFSDWLNLSLPGSEHWDSSPSAAARAFRNLYSAFPWGVKSQILRHALKHRQPRLLLLEDLTDFWIPGLVGFTGVAAAGLLLAKMF